MWSEKVAGDGLLLQTHVLDREPVLGCKDILDSGTTTVLDITTVAYALDSRAEAVGQ